MNNDKYMPLLDVDKDLNIFMTYIPNRCGYAAIIYDYNQTDDYGEGEQAIQSRFYDYMSLDAKPITDYIKGPFFIGVDEDPSKALERATEQCNAYYRAKKEGVEVTLEDGQVKYAFPVIEDDPKRVSFDTNFNHPIEIEQPKFLKDAKVGSPIRTNEQRWAAYHKGETTVGDALLMLDVLATAAAKEAGALDDKVKIHPNLGSALQNIYFSNAILNYRELSVALLNWEAGNEINSKYQHLFKAILNNINHGEDVRAVIDGFIRFVSNNTTEDVRNFELVMCAVKSLQSDLDIQESIKIMTAKLNPDENTQKLLKTFIESNHLSFARAKPTALGGECKKGNIPSTGKPNEWDLLDTDVRAYYDNLAAEELDNDSDSETE